MNKFFFFVCLVSYSFLFGQARVDTGLDVFFSQELYKKLKGKKIGLITNQTGRDKQGRSNISLFLSHANDYTVAALFSPEHGLQGNYFAGEMVASEKGKPPIYSLMQQTRRPTDEMLKGLDVLIFDIQDVGSRPYTYMTTMCYCMEEAAKRNIAFIVLDRPNPLGGQLIDGPMLDENLRSFIGYINVPYCHGLTIGEIAKFFNEEYNIKCNLEVIAMKGWKRFMTFRDTGLLWIPPSPQIPEADTAFFYPATGILGELKLVSIGVGYTLPFKVVAAPWIDAEYFARKLNEQKMKGIVFIPIHFRPQYGPYENEDCHGVMLHITQIKSYRPVSVQYLLIGMLKTLYPKQFLSTTRLNSSAIQLFHKANGSEEVYQILMSEKYVAWKLIEREKEKREEFVEKRKKYLFAEYGP